MEANRQDEEGGMRNPVQNEEAVKRLQALCRRMDSFSCSGYSAGYVLVHRWIEELKAITEELEKESE